MTSKEHLPPVDHMTIARVIGGNGTEAERSAVTSYILRLERTLTAGASLEPEDAHSRAVQFDKYHAMQNLLMRVATAGGPFALPARTVLAGTGEPVADMSEGLPPAEHCASTTDVNAPTHWMALPEGPAAETNAAADTSPTMSPVCIHGMQSWQRCLACESDGKDSSCNGFTREQPASNSLSIPTYSDIAAKDNRDGSLTALEQFIYDNEPANEEDEAIFRSGLLAVLREARSAHEPCGEPVAYLHEITEPSGAVNRMYSAASGNPWSHWVESHRDQCMYTCTPLYTRPAAKPSPAAPAPETSVPASNEIVLTESEIRRLLRCPYALQLVIDGHHVNEAEADAIGEPELQDIVRASEARRKVLEAARDALLVENGDKPGDILIVNGYERPSHEPYDGRFEIYVKPSTAERGVLDDQRDIKLTVSGPFHSDEEKLRYCAEIASLLNRGSQPPSASTSTKSL